jgi:hypothetical protein
MTDALQVRLPFSPIHASLFPTLVLMVMLYLLMPAREANARAVDLELVLAVDCSYSVDYREFRQQRDGLARAFSDAAVVNAIESGPEGAIAVTLVQWSGAEHQDVVVGWTVIRDAASARSFAQRILSAERITRIGSTSISGVIRFAMRLFGADGLQGTRRVIDISSDGRNNSGANVRFARDIALASGHTINGLTILDEHPELDSYFRNNVIGGPSAFVLTAETFESYVEAIRAKLLREIGSAPVASLPAPAFRIFPE